jgi:integrase
VRAQVKTAGTYADTKGETVEALCKRWLASRRDIRPVTVEGYERVLAPVLRRIGSSPVMDVTVSDIDALIAWLGTKGGKRGQALGPRAVRASLVALGQAFDLAAREETISRNVVRLARRPRVRKRVGRDLEHWQPADLVKFRKHADADPLAGAWRLTLCGLTRADVLGLRWSDVDLDSGLVAVSQGRVPLDHGGDHTDEPKSAQRVRAVPVEAIHPGTVALLRSLKATQAAARLKTGPAYVESGYVVVDALGVPVRPEWYSDTFRRLGAAAGVPRITLHSVRHSLAFWLHQIGVAPADAAALLGHTVEVHLSTYLPHSGAAGITAAAEALGRAAAAEY